MSLHHHHTFQFDDNDKPIYFDGVLIHDHPDDDHWDRGCYHSTHVPLGSYIDDSDCNETETFGCPWSKVVPSTARFETQPVSDGGEDRP